MSHSPAAESIRQQLEAIEAQTLSPHAQLARCSAGRLRPEPEDDLRTCYQRDRDRVVHSKAFRRLAGKTQVFLAPAGDHYRTRITHTLEVAQVARTICRCLRLNESLCEAIVMAHDLGHTPFGHAGEKVLAHLMPGGFHHVKQSLRVIDQLEQDGRGLNLTHEVRDGVLKHSKGKGAVLSDNPNLRATTLEGQIVRLADLIAYVNHDLDDAVRARLLRLEEVPQPLLDTLGSTLSQRLRRLVVDVVAATGRSIEAGQPAVRMSSEMQEALTEMRDFLFQRVYESEPVRAEFERAQDLLSALWHHWHRHEAEFRAKHWPRGVAEEEGLDRAIGDFLSGMTDRYAIRMYKERIMPREWPIL
ncbi:MAG: deoxyguanosinetriphosphate triphosphohydrolase [Myxococcales bacterium]|nr:deoxyguanosinetriphosphate triphosphohydrolase [Myxococcota bacterium]MDW8281443.1 deoxyguanosinetriphosphate triphosphohydrolase [Myxococcales bacterium]